jgi:hypothetical protein
MEAICIYRLLGYAGALNFPSSPKSNPLHKESGMSSQAEYHNGAMHEFAEAERGDVRRTKRPAVPHQVARRGGVAFNM